MTTVTGTIVAPTTLLPRVTFARLAASVDTDADVIVLAFTRPAVVLSDGSFSLDLPPGPYVVRITAGAKVVRGTLEVPVDGPIDIADGLIIDAVPDPGGGDPGDPGDITWADIGGKPSTFPPSAHTQAISTITGLQSALDGKAATGHSQAISTVTGLQAALDGKQASGDYATGTELDDLSTIVAGKQAAGSYATTTALTAVADRVTAVESMTPVVRSWNGSAYVEDSDALIYVGPGDPGSAPDGSVWIDTTP